MSDANNYPARLCPHGRTAPTCPPSCTAPLPRAERQRRADNDGRPDRVAELSADLEAYAQAARWSLPVAWAIYFHDDSDIAVELSGDHRPRLLALHPIHL